MKALEAKIREVDGATCLRLSGVIDEHSGFATHTDALTSELIVLDLGGVERVNSAGVRDWLGWIKTLEGSGKRLLFTRCSPPMWAQCSMIADFFGKGAVFSFSMEYYCPSCDHEGHALIQVDTAMRSGEPPPPICELCETEMELDEQDGSFRDLLDEFRREPLSQSDREVLTRLGYEIDDPSASASTSKAPEDDPPAVVSAPVDADTVAPEAASKGASKDGGGGAGEKASSHPAETPAADTPAADTPAADTPAEATPQPLPAAKSPAPRLPTVMVIVGTVVLLAALSVFLLLK